MIWGLFGPPGIREMVIIGLVAFILYGRSGVERSLGRTRYGRFLGPWVTAPGRQAGPGSSAARARTGRAGWGDRWFWLLAAVAVTAVAAWVVTRLLIAAPRLSH